MILLFIIGLSCEFQPGTVFIFQEFPETAGFIFLWHQNFLKGGKSVFGLIRTFWKKQKVFVR